MCTLQVWLCLAWTCEISVGLRMIMWISKSPWRYALLTSSPSRNEMPLERTDSWGHSRRRSFADHYVDSIWISQWISCLQRPRLLFEYPSVRSWFHVRCSFDVGPSSTLDQSITLAVDGLTPSLVLASLCKKSRNVGVIFRFLKSTSLTIYFCDSSNKCLSKRFFGVCLSGSLFFLNFSRYTIQNYFDAW